MWPPYTKILPLNIYIPTYLSIYTLLMKLINFHEYSILLATCNC